MERYSRLSLTGVGQIFISLAQLGRRAVRVLRTEGFPGFITRVNDRFIKRVNDRLQSNCHKLNLYVLSFQINGSSQNLGVGIESHDFGDRRLARLRRTLSDLEFTQIAVDDEGAIDEVTEIDPWRTPRSATLEKLEEGWHCYVVKRGGKIVASGWACIDRTFVEPELKCELRLAPDEAYLYRGFCVPDSRGKGVFPWMVKHMISHLYQSYGKTRHLVFVRVKNKASVRSLTKIGWSVAGRAVSVRFFGVRFQYLWGRGAFSETKRRFLPRMRAAS